jgi:hypothetical protein
LYNSKSVFWFAVLLVNILTIKDLYYFVKYITLKTI